MALYEQNRHFRSAIQQEFKYMRTRGQPWGLVCFLTFWVVLFDDQDRCLFMSEALLHTSHDPTIVMVLLFVVHRNYAHLTAASLNLPASSPNPPPNLTANPPTNLPPIPRVTRSSVAKAFGVASTPIGSTSGRVLPRRRSSDAPTAPLLSSAHFSTSPDSPLASLTWQSLGLKGGYLGVGRSGAVCLGEIDNRKAAVKVVDLDGTDADQRVDELFAEYLAYQRLRDLWGSCVPACLAYGACIDRSCHVLATEVIEGAPLDVSTSSMELRQQVVRVLEKVHRLGVSHGDLAKDNILVRGAEVFLIDFGFSEIDAPKEKLLEEAEELKRTLGLLGDTT